MAEDSDKILQTYMENILRIQRERDQSLSEEELRQIAIETGMSEEDLAYVQQKVRDHLNRGEGFIRYQNWDGAINELDQAVALSPGNTTALCALASAYWNRGKEGDHDRAKAYANRCLRIDSTNDLALRLASAIEKGEKSPQPQQPVVVRPRAVVVTVLVAVVAMIAIVGVGMGLFLTGSSSDKSPSVAEPFTTPSINVDSIIRNVDSTMREAMKDAESKIQEVMPAKALAGDSVATLALMFGEKGIGPGKFEDARSITVDPAGGNIYVAEYAGGRIQVFDSAGKFLSLWEIPKSDYVSALAADRKGNVYAVRRRKLYRYDGATGEAGEVRYGGGEGGFVHISATHDGGLIGLWSGYGGTVMLTERDPSKDAVVRLSSTGKPVKVMNGIISRASESRVLRGTVVTDGLGNIYASHGSSIFRFTSDGKFVDRFNLHGGESGRAGVPEAMAVDGQGRIYVGTWSDVQIFSPDGNYINGFKIPEAADDLAINDRNELFVLSRKAVRKYQVRK